MLTELRRYSILPGKMDLMHERMHAMLLPMFRDQSIPTPRAIWENREETSIFSWIIDWPDFEANQAGWRRIAPIFAAARRAEGTPEIVTRTTLTLIAPWAGADIGFAPGAACETAWHVQPRIGFGAGFVAACQSDVFDIFRAAGASAVNACNFIFGPLPQAMVMLSWPDEQTRSAGMAQIAAMAMPPEIAAALLGEGARFGERGQWEALDRANYLPD
ncbi:MAG: hypothetical protein ABW128_21725 [Rhizorhabdus sp.]